MNVFNRARERKYQTYLQRTRYYKQTLGAVMIQNLRSPEQQ